MATVATESGTNPVPENSYPDLEKLLKLAEDLDAKSQQEERQLLLHLSIAAACIPGLLVLSLWLVGMESLDRPLKYALVTGAGVYCSIFIPLASQLVWRAYKNLARDRRALTEIVDMLREVEYTIAHREQLSALERAAFRIRLSRFDIGPSRASPTYRRW